MDCDPGIGPGLDADDGLALLFALASPELHVEAVTTVFGNVNVRRGTDNALRLLEAAGRTDVPVAMGMAQPVTGRLNERALDDYAAQDRRIPPADEARLTRRAPQHAVDLIIDAVLASPGEITVLAVGPLTNVAMAMLKEPAVTGAIKEVVILGGAFGREPEFGRGNITPVAELNIWNDPLAADIVFTSGAPMRVINLDVSNPNAGSVMYHDQLSDVLGDDVNPLTSFLGEMTRTYIEAPKFNWARNGCVLYDAIAAAVLVDPGLVEVERGRVRAVTQDGPAFGQTILYPADDGHVDVAVAIDGPRFVGLFLERIRSLVDAASTR
ncbi:nucleoside hydrolase [Actinotalea fermentans]|uniref:Nucleoside hydrolase n=2 Tax=Actinotalea fermentans TaxID=43671 RepID=A0A511YZJ5_9CELL|nr:nucleoside hydrolase [Actinotalea fermentans]